MEPRTRGIVLGKFLPPHRGHVYLVRFAAAFVDQLTVLVGTLKREPIDGVQRAAWCRELFPFARVVHITDENPQYPHEHPDFWRIWRETIQRAHPEPISHVFASEDYGVPLARELGATFIPCDIARELVPVSGTAIRENPMRNWRYLPDVVRPHFVKRVCIVGPESTGKSTLAANLARHYSTVHVAEYARGLITLNDDNVTLDDIATIARGQVASEDAMAYEANRVLICDTDTLTTTLWSNVLFGECPAWVDALAAERRYDLTLLTDIDVPFVPDPQRYLPRGREMFLTRCKEALTRVGRPYVVVRGSWDERLATACQAIDQLISER